MDFYWINSSQGNYIGYVYKYIICPSIFSERINISKLILLSDFLSLTIATIFILKNESEEKSKLNKEHKDLKHSISDIKMNIKHNLCKLICAHRKIVEERPKHQISGNYLHETT